MMPYAKRQRPEEQLQRTVCQFLERALPEGAVFFAIPNGHVSRLQRMRLALGGTRSGIPDICVIHKGKSTFIELKSARGVLSPAQKHMHTQLVLAGAVVFTAKTLAQVDGFLSQIMPLKAHVA